MNKEKIKIYAVWILIAEAVGALSGFMSRKGMEIYSAYVQQPPLSPPGWVFPIVWTILYVLMGEAAYRVLTSGADKGQIKKALIAYGVQLFLNFLWPLVFFGGQMYLTAFILLIALWIAILITARWFSQINETAGDLMLPYLLWVTFAGYLNLGVFLLN